MACHWCKFEQQETSKHETSKAKQKALLCWSQLFFRRFTLDWCFILFGLNTINCRLLALRNPTTNTLIINANLQSSSPSSERLSYEVDRMKKKEYCSFHKGSNMREQKELVTEKTAPFKDILICESQPKIERNQSNSSKTCTPLSTIMCLQLFKKLSGQDDSLFWVSSSTLKAKYLRFSQGTVWDGVTLMNWPRPGQRSPGLKFSKDSSISGHASLHLAVRMAISMENRADESSVSFFCCCLKSATAEKHSRRQINTSGLYTGRRAKHLCAERGHSQI